MVWQTRVSPRHTFCGEAVGDAVVDGDNGGSMKKEAESESPKPGSEARKEGRGELE